MKLDFKRNLGLVDRVIRFILGIVIIVLTSLEIINISYLNIFFFLFGISQIIESLLGY